MTTADADVPLEFARALAAMRDHRLRPEVRLTEVPAPTRIAPYAVALSGEVHSRALEDEEPATGRFVVLHDPSGQEAWEGTFRVVSLVRAALDPEAGADPVLADAAWSWVEEALAGHAADWRALGGTVTRVDSRSFGALTERPDEVEVEIRASWTPVGDLGDHLRAWGGLLCTAAGLPPLPPGVTPLGRRG